MGKNRSDWPQAKKLCRLNQNDIEMAKRLGFGPEALIRAIPNPRQGWKLPVELWIRELHSDRFGDVLGEKPLSKPLPAPRPTTPEEEKEAARLFGEELYWEEYHERNQE